MEPAVKQWDEEYRRKVLAARRMTSSERIREGFRLFEEECAAARALIRRDHPEADEKQVLEFLEKEFEAERRFKDEMVRSGLLP